MTDRMQWQPPTAAEYSPPATAATAATISAAAATDAATAAAAAAAAVVVYLRCLGGENLRALPAEVGSIYYAARGRGWWSQRARNASRGRYYM